MSIGVLIVDDTVTYRQILTEVLSGMDGVTSVDTAANGSIAIKKLALKPAELVLLDVEMPVMDGIETLQYIRQNFPESNVVMISGCSVEATKITMQALKMGALEFIRKPEGKNRDENKIQIQNELKSIVNIIRTRSILYDKKIVRQEHPSAPQPESGRIVERAPQRFQRHGFGIVCIGVSTGGPNALTKLVVGLDSSFPVPIVVVQHMPPNFTAALAEDLNKKSSLRVIEAYENLEVRPGTMIIARGGMHMVIRLRDAVPVIGVIDEPPENSCKPAVDVLFRSVANHFGERGVLALIMTGMGADGLAGVKVLKRKSCYCITQSAPSCVVYGMPRSIDEAQLSDESVNLDELAVRLNQIVRQK